jgi:hypothetical protein
MKDKEYGPTLNECIIQFLTTDTKEEFIVKALEAFQIVKKNLIDGD